MTQQRLIKVGKVSGVFGVKGWVKVFSHTETKENILRYTPWLLSKAGVQKTVNVLDGAIHGKSIIALLEGVDDRDRAAALLGCDIYIKPEQLPKAKPNEYYWSDLIGLKVETVSGTGLGVVDSLMETGANDVLIVHGERERAIPFLQGQTIVTVDLDAGTITVDWDPDF